jgi:hypothetical protein
MHPKYFENAINKQCGNIQVCLITGKYMHRPSLEKLVADGIDKSAKMPRPKVVQKCNRRKRQRGPRKIQVSRYY